MSQSFELYVARDSWLHRLDPRTKLCIVLVAGSLALLFQHLALLAAVLILAHVALLTARIPIDSIRWLWARLAPLLIMILILQPLFAPGPGPALVELGPIRLTVGGILNGISFALRAAALAFVSMVLLLTTEPSQLVQGLVKLGLPYTWGLTVGLAIRYLPVTANLFTAASEAQQARGWVVGQGGFLKRIRSYLPILVATIIAALRLSDNLGLALAARGLEYPAQRTVLHDLKMTRTDGLVVVLSLLIFAALLVVRFVLDTGAQPW
jgi:energy-coupling factor transport system permease protein